MNLENLNNQESFVTEFFIKHPCYKADIWYGDEMEVAKESSRRINPYRNRIDFSSCKNSNIKDEIKCYFGKNLQDSLYSVITVFEGKAHHLKRMLKFLDEKYPNIKTILEISKTELMLKYTNYLVENGIKVKSITRNHTTAVTPAVSLMSTFYNYIYDAFDQTPEYEKDIWDGSKLPVELNYTNTSTKRMKFTKINQKHKELLKKYIYTRVVEMKNLTFSIGIRYLHELSIFLNFLYEKYPELLVKDIKRRHIVDYLEVINNKMILDIKTRKKIKATNTYISGNITIVRKFLGDLKIMEWDEAPFQHIESLFLPSDNPRRTKSQSFNSPKYIPDYIWDQVVENIHLIGDRYVPIILVMEGSGFRGSDVLGLKINCLEKDNKSDYWLIGDQRKINYKEHKVPISEQLAKVIMSQQEICKQNSTPENNPESFLFVSYRGPRKGKPQTTSTLSRVLNEFAEKANIRDVNGEVYRFKNHAFRHRYGVTLINNGMNIVHVQKLMAHASPEMTLAYAKIHDQTLKEAYFKAKSKGGVKFNIEGVLVKIDIDEQAIENDLELEWIRHNYDSIRMDHGMCIKSTKMKCDYAEKVIEPPCIANNCRSFHVDSSFIDYYKSQITALENDIRIYERNNHLRSLEFANKKIQNYRKILNEISNGGSISGMKKERREYVGEERGKSVE
ncbi:tyrosine-type recombinase/integrase [Bacillus paramycoides]|uniref:tyrosine-type recombinase/integrase n=1 Tax=Bacillus paramycoides TaxID=2026194 RepID=UPI002E214B9D|nr:tyrosine-type recombinase/integrase [Bacillus paramycoides]MED0962372.1 tyrosine-type recombinase/integrase [Bacillus paramycoides]